MNIVPKIESIFRWEDKVDSAEEWLLVIKTTSAGFERVRDAIKELHSYDLPECIAIKITEGSKECLDWIAASVAAEA